jgi:hypothetical protein
MKTLRTLCAAVALTFALTSPAFAGVITSMKDGEPPPPPSATSVTQSDPTGGIISTDANSTASVSTDSVTEVALSLLQNALTLL